MQKSKAIKTKQGFIWVYRYKEEGKIKTISSINLYSLKMKVLDKGLKWIEYSDQAKELVENDKALASVNFKHHSSKNKTGFYRVHKSYKNYEHWVYTYYENGKYKKIISKDIYKLKMKVLKNELEWIELTDEAKDIIKKAEKEHKK